MAERGQGAAFDQLHIAARRRPVGVALERKIGAEAQAAGDRHQRLFDPAAQALAGAHARRDHDLAAGATDAGELVQRLFRVGHRGDDILRDHHVEAVVGELQRLGIAIGDLLDMERLPRFTRSRALSSIGSERSTPTIRLLREYWGSEMPVPTPTSMMRPPMRSAATMAAERPFLKTGPKTRS